MAERRMAAGVAATAGVCLALLLIVGYTAGPMSQVELKVRHRHVREEICATAGMVCGGGQGEEQSLARFGGEKGFCGWPFTVEDISASMCLQRLGCTRLVATLFPACHLTEASLERDLAVLF
jgi:hypothetical protein